MLAEAITEKTRAIIPVHLYGQMCDMRRIREIGDKYGLVIIEDAAHCIEGERDGVGPGELGDAACFSFYATKNITSGEGGAIATKDHEKAGILRVLRLHGLDRSAADRYSKKYKHWDMPMLGWKYNMDNLQGALLSGQLERIDSLWDRRRHIARIYEERLGDLENIRLLKTIPGSRHARHLFTILAPEGRRDDYLAGLQARNIGVAVNYRAVHLLEYYRETFGFGPNMFPAAENIGHRTISIPLYPKLTDDEISYVISEVTAVQEKS